MKTRVFFSMDTAQDNFGPCAVTIGNFDGVHLGHRALLRAAVAYAAEHSLKPAVLTFHPHPATFVAPERVPELICSLEERIRLLSEAGAERILVLPFNEMLARFSPREFVSQILVKGLHAQAVFVGENFRFGHQKAGDSTVLAALGQEYDFAARFLPPVMFRGKMVSSSAIRHSLKTGAVALAGRMLGQCFTLRGPVVKGHGVGSKQTVPTLNLNPPGKGHIAPRGVYVTETVDLATRQLWPSITNAGTRPTFAGQELAIETFLLTPLEGPPPENLELRFRRFIRAERQFPDPAALKAQILLDVKRANAFWRRLGLGAR